MGGAIKSLVAESLREDMNNPLTKALLKPIAIDAERIKSLVFRAHDSGMFERIMFDRIRVNKNGIVETPPEALQAPVAPKPREPTLADIIAKASEPTYTEIYAAFRYREQAEGDRLLDCMATAPSLDEAVAKLIRLGGYDEATAETLGLTEYDAGTVLDLCTHLKQLTGDTYEVSPYEQPV